MQVIAAAKEAIATHGAQYFYGSLLSVGLLYHLYNQVGTAHGERGQIVLAGTAPACFALSALRGNSTPTGSEAHKPQPALYTCCTCWNAVCVQQPRTHLPILDMTKCNCPKRLPVLAVPAVCVQHPGSRDPCVPRRVQRGEAHRYHRHLRALLRQQADVGGA